VILYFVLYRIEKAVALWVIITADAFPINIDLNSVLVQIKGVIFKAKCLYMLLYLIAFHRNPLNTTIIIS